MATRGHYTLKNKGIPAGAGLRFGFQKGELPVEGMGKSKAEKGQSQGQTESLPTVERKSLGVVFAPEDRFLENYC